MKTKMILAAALAVAMFASCAKDTGNDQNKAGKIGGKEAKLNIAISSPTSPTRSTGTPAVDVVEHYTAFVVYSNNSVQVVPSATADALTNVPVTTSAEYVYIVANAGATDFSGITTKSDLDDYLIDLKTTGSQDTYRWATGVSDKLVFLQSGTDFVATPNPVELTFVAGRITLEIENGMTGYDATAADGSLVLKNVAIVNGGAQSKIFGTSLAPATMEYYSGFDNPTPGDFAYWPADYSVDAIMTDAIAADDFTTKYYYYVFENPATTAAAFPTIVTIVGEFDGEEVYYPVHLAPYEQFDTGTTTATSVERGNSYDIKITLSVDPTIGGGDPGGTDDPTNPVVNAFVNISVDLNDWIPVPLVKEFE